MVLLAMFFLISKYYRRVSQAGAPSIDTKIFLTRVSFWGFLRIWAYLLPVSRVILGWAVWRLSSSSQGLAHCWLRVHSCILGFHPLCSHWAAQTRSSCPCPQGAYSLSVLTFLPCAPQLSLVFFTLFFDTDNLAQILYRVSQYLAILPWEPSAAVPPLS